MALSAKVRAASRNASWSSVRLKSIVQLPFSPLTQLDGEVGFRRRCLRAEPAGGHGLGFGVETHGLLAVSVLVTVEGTLPASEREERQWHRNRNIHTHLANFDLVLERSEEHTSELQSRPHLVCRLQLEKKKNNNTDA